MKEFPEPLLERLRAAADRKSDCSAASEVIRRAAGSAGASRRMAKVWACIIEAVRASSVAPEISIRAAPTPGT